MVGFEVRLQLLDAFDAAELLDLFRELDGRFDAAGDGAFQSLVSEVELLYFFFDALRFRGFKEFCNFGRDCAPVAEIDGGVGVGVSCPRIFRRSGLSAIARSAISAAGRRNFSVTANSAVSAITRTTSAISRTSGRACIGHGSRGKEHRKSKQQFLKTKEIKQRHWGRLLLGVQAPALKARRLLAVSVLFRARLVLRAARVRAVVAASR